MIDGPADASGQVWLMLGSGAGATGDGAGAAGFGAHAETSASPMRPSDTHSGQMARLEGATRWEDIAVEEGCMNSSWSSGVARATWSSQRRSRRTPGTHVIAVFTARESFGRRRRL